MASIVHSRMARLYAGPRSITGSFDSSLSQTFVTAELSLDSCSLAADALGVVLSYVGAVTTLTVRVAGRIDSGWTVSKADGAGITSTLSGSTVTVTDLTVDFATITLTATKDGYSGVTKTFAVSRVKQGAKGEDGAGDSVDIVFRRATTQPSPPAASSGTPPDWYSDVASVPAGSGSIWSSVGKKATADTNYTWQTPVKIEGSDGVSGLSIVELTIFKRTTASETPSGGTYNFATKTLTPPSGWSVAVPSGTDPVYTSRATVSSANPAATAVSVSGWTASVVSFQNGTNGSKGDTGSPGTRGTVQLIASGSSWSDTTANSAITSATGSSTRIIGDIVTITNNTSFSQTRAWNGSSWIAASAYINGNMIVSGTIVADQIAAGTMTGSTIRTGSGTTRVEMSASDNALSVWVGGSRMLKIGDPANGWMTGTSGILPAIYLTGGSTCIVASSTSPTGSTISGSNTSSGQGVYGFCNGVGTGVRGRNTSTGIGVEGENTGTGRAGWFQANGNVDGAIFCRNTGTGSTSAAVKAENGNGTARISLAAGTWAAYANNGSVGPFTGAHDALVSQYFEADEGDILIDTEVFSRNGISDTITRVTVSSAPAQKASIGVLASAPARLDDSHLPSAFSSRQDSAYQQASADGLRLVMVNSLGEGQINICGEGGDIEAGDLIVTSSMPGKGMKQLDDIVRSITVAKARESVTFSSPTEVKQVACIYLCG